MGHGARAQGPLAYVIQPEPQPGRLRHAEPELRLALSSSDAPARAPLRRRPGSRTSVRAAPAMQSLIRWGLYTYSRATLLIFTFKQLGRCTAACCRGRDCASPARDDPVARVGQTVA